MTTGTQLALIAGEEQDPITKFTWTGVTEVRQENVKQKSNLFQR